MKKYITLFLLLFSLIASGQMRNYNTTVIALDRTYKVGVFTPLTYDSTKLYHAVFFLHGFGETGPDINRVYNTGFPYVLKNNLATVDYLVFVPQNNWGGYDGYFDDIVAAVEARYKIKSLGICGLSGGGGNAWEAINGISAAFSAKWRAAEMISASSFSAINMSWVAASTTKFLNRAGTQSGDDAYRGNAINGHNAVEAVAPGRSRLILKAGIGHGGSFITPYSDTAFLNFMQPPLDSVTIVGVANSEYCTGYRMSDGTARIWSEATIPPVLTQYIIMDSLVTQDGAQYTSLYADQQGKVYIADNLHTQVDLVVNDTLGVAFTGNFQIRGFWRNYLSIRNKPGADSTLWYWGLGDIMNYVGGANITSPINIPSPGGRKAKKIETGSPDAFGALTKFYVLYSDSTVWRFNRGAGMASTNITPSGEKVVDFGIASFYGIAMVTASNKIFSQGDYDGRYVGQTTHSTSIVDVTTNWTAAGLTFPVKEIASGYEVFQMIDNNNNLYASGSNGMGNIGTGDQRPLLKNVSGTHGVWGVDFSVHGFMLVPPTLIARGVKNLQGGTTLAFQRWMQDLNNNFYSWGRAKSWSLGNGVSLGPYVGWGGTGDQASYPNALSVTMPKKVTPLLTPYVLINFNPEDDQPPSVGAGIGQYGVASNTTTLYGKVHQQEFTITSTTWSKISGPVGGTITSPSSLTTTVTALQTGTYFYKLSSLNSNSQTSTDSVEIVVTNGNASPTVNAGVDQTITLPTSSVSFSSSASDPDGTISTYAWSKISGPGTQTITSPATATTNVNGLQQGTYIFRITVTDNGGATAFDEITVTVNAAPIIISTLRGLYRFIL